MSGSEFSYTGLSWLLISLAFFNFLDYLATQSLVVFGKHGELNPLMGALIGTPYFAIYKLLLIPLGLLLLWRLRKKLVPKYLRLVKVTWGVYALLMVYIFAVFYI